MARYDDGGGRQRGRIAQALDLDLELNSAATQAMSAGSGPQKASDKRGAEKRCGVGGPRMLFR